MYQHKLTKAEREEKFNRLVKERNFLEKTKEVIEWKKFISLPQVTQQRIYQKWDEYYEQVKNSVSYAIFLDQKEAMARKDLAKVRELGQTAREMRLNNQTNDIPKPAVLDPWDFSRGNVLAYKKVSQTIKELTNNTQVNEEERTVWIDD